jgi:hypothetical protein
MLLLDETWEDNGSCLRAVGERPTVNMLLWILLRRERRRVFW